MKGQETVIGRFKEFILVEREYLNELSINADELIEQGEYDTVSFIKGTTMKEMIEKLKEANVYSRDFKFK